MNFFKNRREEVRKKFQEEINQMNKSDLEYLDRVKLKEKENADLIGFVWNLIKADGVIVRSDYDQCSTRLEYELFDTPFWYNIWRRCSGSIFWGINVKSNSDHGFVIIREINLSPEVGLEMFNAIVAKRKGLLKKMKAKLDERINA